MSHSPRGVKKWTRTKGGGAFTVHKRYDEGKSDEFYHHSKVKIKQTTYIITYILSMHVYT